MRTSLEPPLSPASVQRLSWGLIGAILLALGPTTPAEGHASLVRAEPSANVILEARPKVLRLGYDEEVVPGLSLITILDRSNYVVVQGGSVDSRDRKVLELPVEQLRPGIYTVSWKVLSAVDGHITRGAFAFTFLPPGTDPATLLESGRSGATRAGRGSSLLALVQVLAGWVHLVALFIGVGGLHFALVVLAPRSTTDQGELVEGGNVRDPAARMATTAFGAALVSGLVWWEMNTHLTTDTTLAHFLFRPILVPYLLGSRITQSMGLRVGLLLVALIFLGVAKRKSPPSRLLLVYCEAVGAAALLGIALSSHSAAARPGPLTVAFDTLHLWAAALWVGGLIFLATILPRALREKESEAWPRILLAMRRFTPWAAGSVAVLALTGAFQVFLHVPEPAAMLRTNYGRTLTSKLLLVLPMLVLGAVNSLAARPGGTGRRSPAGRICGRLSEIARGVLECGSEWLRSRHWAVRGEAALAVGILFCVAVLTRLPPPKAASSAPPPTTQPAKVSGLNVELTIASPEGLLAPSDLTVRVRQADGRAAEGITRVTIKPSMPGMEMTISPIVATPGESGEYRGRTLFSMLGRWEIAVVIRRKGVEEDATVRFPYGVIDVASGQTEVGSVLPERLSFRAAWSASSSRGRFWTGVSLIAIGLAIGGVLGARGRLWGRRRLWLSLAGLPFLLVGGHQVVSATVVDTTPTAWQANPIASAAASLAKGRSLFVANCSVCHGEGGRGGGPLVVGQVPGLSLRADLTGDHMEAHSDGDLFWWISKGVRGAAMPGFEDSLRPEDRWHLVNYVRSLRSRGGGGTP